MSMIQMTSLGQPGAGRFGNQLFQAAFLLGFAERHGCVCQLPENWIGRKIFKITNPPISIGYQPLPMEHIPQIVPDAAVFNFQGYYQYQDALNYYSVAQVMKWFEFQDWVTEMFPKPEIPYFAVHIRHGDYLKLQHCFCIPSQTSYEDILNRTYGTLKQQLSFNMPLKIVTEETAIINPELEKQGLGFLPDFMTLYRSSMLIRSNSTFSWWASALSDKQNKTWSPLVENKVGVQDVSFIKGNHPRMADQSNHPGSRLTDLHLN